MKVCPSPTCNFANLPDDSVFCTECGTPLPPPQQAPPPDYNQITEKRLFFMTLDASWGNALDLDNLEDLGGDSGLRGYPLRYQTGDSRVILTAEQRYFTDWYPFRLFRVGGAMFADIGRTWGDNPVGGPPLGWLKNIGVGIRLGPTRSSGRDMIHIDVAFPLDGDPSIDSVQLLVESKRSF